MAFGLAALGACGNTTRNPAGTSVTSSTGGTTGTSSDTSASTTSSTGSGGSAAAPSCDDNLFQEQVFANSAAPPRVVYSWTVPEHIERLRSDKRLLFVSEQAGKGRGFAFEALDNFAAGAPTSDAGKLAAFLSQELFQFIRYAWHNPWATRMGWPGESYGNQLIRIELKEEAWVARFMVGQLDVVDLMGRPIPLEQALSTPERIAMIFFVRDAGDGGPTCDTFSSGDDGYREFILGNEAMIQEWSIATEQIRERLTADIGLLTRFFECIRDEPVPTLTNSSIVCAWYFGQPSRITYFDALALPSPYYEPTPANISTIINTLTEDLFEPDPLLVEPDAVGLGDGGAAGSG